MKPTGRSSAVVIFMRTPFHEQVKTRLAKTIGRQKASRLYGFCVENVVTQISRLSPEVEKHIFLSEPVDEAKIESLKQLGFNVEVQQGANLGYRLRNAFYSVFGKGVKKALIVASDVPDLTAGIVEQAIDRLNNCDLVIGPSHDGGYYLIGLRRFNESLFNHISWGTERVCQQTLDAANKEGLAVGQLPTLIDIDTETDLRQWMEAEGTKNQAILDFVKTERL